jgi:hypothetical protein
VTAQDLKRIKHLLNLADAAADFEHVDINLVSHFHALREDLGLAKLLLAIQDYVQQQSKSDTQIPNASQQNQKPNVVQ